MGIIFPYNREWDKSELLDMEQVYRGEGWHDVGGGPT